MSRLWLQDNDIEDCYIEVNHGPYLLDSNLLLSECALRDRSQGGAYAHNLIAGKIVFKSEPERSTPYLEPQGTAIAGVEPIPGGDDRFFNNLFVGATGLGVYQDPAHPIDAADNVYLAGADPAPTESDPRVLPECDPELTLVGDGDRCSLTLDVDDTWSELETRIVTTQRLGTTVRSDQGFTAPDGSAVAVDRDYAGAHRDRETPTVGPFEGLQETTGSTPLDLWPRAD